MSNPAKYEIDAELVNPDAAWTRVDISSIWSSELFPILDSSKQLQKELEKAVNSWARDGYCYPCSLKRPWRYDDPEAPLPFFLSKSDGADMWVEERIAEAAEAGNPLALEYRCLFDTEIDPDTDAEEYERLMQRSFELQRHFWPDRRATPIAIRPYGCCHYWSVFSYRLAKAWKRTGWKILRSDYHHSTVIDPKNLLVFDLLLLDDAAREPVLFALGDDRSATIKRIEETRRYFEEISRRKRSNSVGVPA